MECYQCRIPREICKDGSLIFLSHETQDFFKRFHIKHRVSTVSNAHLNLRGELAVKSLKRILREYVGGTGNLDSDAITQAMLSHAHTPCKILKLSPAQLAFGRCLKDFFPRNVESLMPIPGNLLTAEVKDKLQGKICADARKRWDEHTKVLPELQVGDTVQMQNLRGKYPFNYNS